MKNYFNKCFFAALFAGIAVAFAGGCCHSQVFTEPIPGNSKISGGRQPVAYGRAQNSGYYLFNILPLYTGHPYHPNRKDYRAWHDDINPDVNAGMLLYSMKTLYDADELADVVHQESSWGYFSLWIVWRKTVSTTAVGMKKIKPKKQPPAKK